MLCNACWLIALPPVLCLCTRIKLHLYRPYRLWWIFLLQCCGPFGFIWTHAGGCARVVHLCRTKQNQTTVPLLLISVEMMTRSSRVQMSGLMQLRQIQATWNMSRASMIKEVKSIIPLSHRAQGTHRSHRPEAGLFIKTLHVHPAVQMEAQGGAESTSRTVNPVTL